VLLADGTSVEVVRFDGCLVACSGLCGLLEVKHVRRSVSSQ
jgi:hypothetical protein